METRFQNTNIYYRLRNISNHSIKFSIDEQAYNEFLKNGGINDIHLSPIIHSDLESADDQSASSNVIKIQPKQVFTITEKFLNIIEEKSLNTAIKDGALEITKLNIHKDESYKLRNETAHPIVIKHINDSEDTSKNIFISPFDSTTLFGYELKDYNFESWERYKFISFEGNKVFPVEQIFQRLIILLAILFTIFLAISIPVMANYNDIANWQLIIKVSLIYVLASVILWAISRYIYVNEKWSASIHGVLQSSQPIFIWLKLSPGMILVLIVGISLPLGTIYLWGDGQYLLNSRSMQMATIGRILQAFFIMTTSLLPALFYFLFGRNLIDQRKRSFIRDALLLDPNTNSVPEAQAKYGLLLDSIYGTANSPIEILLLLFSTALITMGWIITLSPIGQVSSSFDELVDFFVPVKTAFTFGFLGSYFFIINLIFRRYVREDLTTKTYAYIIVRLLTNITLVFTIESLYDLSNSLLGESGIFAVAFIVGIFPGSGFMIIRDYARSIINKTQNTNLSENDIKLSLIKLEGVNMYDEANFLEEGIENIENLAHANLMRLMATTRYPTSRLVDMIDQAILFLHLEHINDNEEKDSYEQLSSKDVKSFQSKLKALGIRTASDLFRLRKESGLTKNQILERYEEKALQTIVNALKDDDWFIYILKWRHSSTFNPVIDEPTKIFDWITEYSKKHI